jgi:hypothetical protein
MCDGIPRMPDITVHMPIDQVSRGTARKGAISNSLHVTNNE